MANPPPIPLGSSFFSTCPALVVGCTLYSDNPLATPVDDNYYSDGTWCYTVSGGNGEIISKTSVADCFTTTTSTTTSSTTSPSGYYKFGAYILPWTPDNPTYWCPFIFGAGEAPYIDIWTNNQNPEVNLVGSYWSIAESSCLNYYNGLPITNYIFAWSPQGQAVAYRKLVRINNFCIVTNVYDCFNY